MDVDLVWSAVLDVLRELAPVEVGVSRFGPKPAIRLYGREIAHWDGPGELDLRVTAAGWADVAGEFADDPGVTRERGRRDWIGLHPADEAEVARYRPLLEAAIAGND
jgi:hypothetical protein